MKKWIIVGGIIIAVAAVAGSVWVGVAYAQGQTPPIPGWGYGMMGNWGYGPMHQYMVTALADALNMTPEDLQSHINQGETPWQVAQSQGLSQDQIQQVMQDVQDKALDEAVQAGLLTQDQADWMDQHMESMWSGNFGGYWGRPGYSGGTGAPNPGNRFGPMMGGRRGR